MSETWRDVVGEPGVRYLGVLWGKSDKDGGQVNLLVQHLFDAMAVGELIWDRYLAPGLRNRLDVVAGGDGRSLLAWLCGAHDWGKASPAFQSQAPHLAQAVEDAGLLGAVTRQRVGQQWRHERAGALIAREHLADAWSDAEAVAWVWPMIAGHHGTFPSLADVARKRTRPKGRDLHGSGEAWDVAHRAVVDAVTAACGYPDLASVEPSERPSRADQLLLSGLIVMADWIASNQDHIDGISHIDAVSVGEARERALNAWAGLQIRGGWGRLVEPEGDVVRLRFGQESRPAQVAVVEAARSMAEPGLLLVEAPTGEGKTEAALAAAEVMAARFGADGVYVGLPTQATSDPMLTRVRQWLATFDPIPPIALLHGKRRFNPEWKRLADRPLVPHQPEDLELDDYGMPVDLPSIEPPPAFGGVCEDGCQGEEMGAEAAARWFLGSYRGLLSPNGVGTIDQVLYAGTCTHHVMLRYAGLAGKVVILDEVHAADAYMSQFLGEVLTWLGQGRVPVILLSATLAPDQRRDLVECYLAGALEQPDLEVSWAAAIDGYPAALSVWARDGEARHAVHVATPWRPPATVELSVVDETGGETVAPVVALLEEPLAEGGVALVLRNTVGRAQEIYSALADRYPPGELVLLHSRFTAARRAELTELLLSQLDDGGEQRPRGGGRLIVVATQVAEQSFDVDVDLLISDLAPVDLLVQRAGRLHRHDRPAGARPPGLRTPRVVITGVDTTGEVPTFPKASEKIYSAHLLLQTASKVLDAVGAGGWTLPTQVPDLVRRVYGPDDLGPEAWGSAVPDARQLHLADVAAVEVKAQGHLLTSSRQMTARTLESLNDRGVASGNVEGRVKVRDGDMGAEVVLVCHVDGRFRTLGGRDLGVNADAGWDHAEEVLGATVRLPAYGQFCALTELAERLPTIPAWSDHPWLRWTPVVRLDGDHRADLGQFSLHYDAERGLSVEPTR